MSWQGKMIEFSNRILGKAKLRLIRESSDFEDRLQSRKHLLKMFQDLADVTEKWVAEQKLFEVRQHFSFLEEVEGFYEDYLRMPFRDQHGGSRFNNALWLNLLAKLSQPNVIVDSGTYTGASAWALSRGAPRAVVFSFDIDLSHLRWRAPNVKYVRSDWASFDFSDINVKNSLCYFDDHVDQARRLLEMRRRGFKLGIFDDDFSIGAFPMNKGTALPKIEFILDGSLKNGDEIAWIYRGKKQIWHVDRKYLDRAKSTISATDRLPNTSLTTGIHQTPYRIVALFGID